VRTMTMYVGSSVARLLSSRYTKGTEQSIFWVTAISKEVCFVLFLAGFPELVRGAFSTPPVGRQSPRTIRLPSTQAATTVFSGGAPGAGAARLTPSTRPLTERPHVCLRDSLRYSHTA